MARDTGTHLTATVNAANGSAANGSAANESAANESAGGMQISVGKGKGVLTVYRNKKREMFGGSQNR